jgi:hypothetical protein
MIEELHKRDEVRLTLLIMVVGASCEDARRKVERKRANRDAIIL